MCVCAHARARVSVCKRATVWVCDCVCTSGRMCARVYACLSACLPVWLSGCASAFMYVMRYGCLSVCLSVCQPDCKYGWLSAGIGGCMSVWLPFYMCVWVSVYVFPIVCKSDGMPVYCPVGLSVWRSGGRHPCKPAGLPVCQSVGMIDGMHGCVYLSRYACMTA